MDGKNLPKLKKVIAKAGAVVLEKKEDAVIVEVANDQEHIRNFLAELKDFKVVEVVRSGRIAIAK